jgi:hypothetical protein
MMGTEEGVEKMMTREEFGKLVADFGTAAQNVYVSTEPEYACALREVMAVFDAQAARIRSCERVRAIQAEALRENTTRITALEAALARLVEYIGHIKRWCEQDQSVLSKQQIVTAVVRMCDDALDAAREVMGDE